MAKVTASQYVDKWARNLISAGPSITDGVNNVTEAPGIKAARKGDKWMAGLTRSFQDGTWQRAVGAVTLEDWKSAVITKGIPRISVGVNQAKPKQLLMAEKLLAAVDSVTSIINQMPDNTLEERISKSAAFQRAMAEKRIK